MDQRERLDDMEEGIRLAIRAQLLALQTCLPVRIESVDLAAMTVTAQPLIKAQRQLQDGSIVLETLPLIINCPIVFQGGGGWTFTFPIAPGDEAIVILSSRSIDNWWLAGGIQSQVELRAHSLDDGFVFVGPRSQPNVLESIDAVGPQLRSDDGLQSIGFVAGGILAIKAPGGVTVNGTPLIVP